MKNGFGVEISKIAQYGVPVYHGTTQRNANNILRNGFKPEASAGVADKR